MQHPNYKIIPHELQVSEAFFKKCVKQEKDTLEIDAVPSGAYNFEWVDPATGSLINSGTIQWMGGNLCLSTPEYKLDIALYLNRN